MSINKRVSFAGLACLAAVLSLVAGLVYGTPKLASSIESGLGLPVMPLIGGCPRCHKKDQVIPIMYGYPAIKAVDEYDEGKIYLGGCLVTDDSPTKYCKRCDFRF